MWPQRCGLLSKPALWDRQTDSHISRMMYGSKYDNYLELLSREQIIIILPKIHTHNCSTAVWILSGTTWVSCYQKKHSPTHTYADHRSSFIYYFYLLWSICITPVHAGQSFSTISAQVFFGLPLGLAHCTSYISSPNHFLLFATHDHTIATCFAVVPRLYHLILVSLLRSHWVSPLPVCIGMWGRPWGDIQQLYFCSQSSGYFLVQSEDNTGRLWDASTIWMDTTPSKLIGAPTSAIPTIFTPDALPGRTLPIYPGLREAPSMLVCILGGLVFSKTMHIYIINNSKQCRRRWSCSCGDQNSNWMELIQAVGTIANQ